MMQASSFAVKARLQPVALAVALQLAPLGAALAQNSEGIGRVQQTQGLVTLTRGAAAQVVEAGTDLQAGDVVETQRGSAAALRYADGTQVQLGAGSRFTVSQMLRNPDRPQEERLTAQLLKGAMRVLTGSIAQRRPENARFSTGTATIGIRGTDFSVRICEDDCRAADGPQVASRRLPELAGRVGAAGGGVSAIDARGLWRGLNASSAVRPGDLLITGNSGVAIVVLTDGTRISLDPNSRFWIADYSFDAARPEAGRIALELVQGAAQVASGQLAKIRPERFAFAAGEQVLRVHGTSWGAVVNTVNNAANDGADAGRNAANNAQDAAQNAANSAGNAAQNAVNTATDTAKTIVTNTGQTAAAAGQQGSQLASTVANQVSQVAGQVTQQGQTQFAQGSQAVAGALPPAPPPVSLPAAPAPSGPPGPGYDITGGKVLNGASFDTITQGTFNTVITGQTQRQENYTFLVTETTEQIVPPTQVRTASGMLMTGGTILRRVDFNTVTGVQTMTITFVGVTFAPPSSPGQPPQPGRPMVSACSSCTGLVAQGWDVVPTQIEEARLRREAAAQQANRNSTGSGSGSGMMPLSCAGSSAQCDEVRRAREQEQANQRNTRSNRSGSSGSSSSSAPSPASAPAPAPAPTAAAPAPAPASSNSTIVVTDGAVTSYSRGQSQGQFIAAGQLYNVNIEPASSAAQQSTTQRNLRMGSLPFVAPALDERSLSVDSTRLFGADVLRAQGAVPPATGFAPAGVYVHVQDGAVSLAQDGQEVVIGRGETASAPAGGGAPSRVLRGVRVVAPALVSATRIATQGQCSADSAAGSSPTPPAPSMWGGRRVTASQSDLPDLRWTGEAFNKLNEKETSQATGGESSQGFDRRWGVGFGNTGRQSAFDQARGNGLQGAGRLQGPQNIVGGRYLDTFMGNRINNASGQDITLGGKPGRVGNLDRGGRVSSGANDTSDTGLGGLIAEMLKMEGGTATGDATQDAAELSYAQSVGPDGYAATKNMSTSERQSYWGAERDQQMTGGGRMTPADAEAERNRQQQGGKENPDACASCGGNSIPLFLNSGQFGNEIRGVERAVNARVNRAGGAADGRGERDASGGSTGGVMMSRNAQVGGTVRAAQTGTLNVDEALKLNRLVNPGAQ